MQNFCLFLRQFGRRKWFASLTTVSIRPRHTKLHATCNAVCGGSMRSCPQFKDVDRSSAVTLDTFSCNNHNQHKSSACKSLSEQKSIVKNSIVRNPDFEGLYPRIFHIWVLFLRQPRRQNAKAVCGGRKTSTSIMDADSGRFGFIIVFHQYVIRFFIFPRIPFPPFSPIYHLFVEYLTFDFIYWFTHHYSMKIRREEKNISPFNTISCCELVWSPG